MKTIFHFFKKTSGVFGLVFFFLLGNINAQNNTPPKNQSSISLIAQSKDGQIQLRWAPADPAMWLEGIRKGYTIERQAIQPGKRFSPKQFEILNPTPIKPYPLTDFETAYRQSPENEYLLVAAECIYGDWKDAKKGAANLNNWIAASDDFYSKFSFHLFATEMNFIAAEASGFAFVDATAVRGQQYIYKVYIQGENGKKKYAVYQNVNNTEQPQPIPNIHSVENGEQKVVLSWARAWHNEHFSAYFIERSADGKSFKKINSTPYVHGLSDDANLHSPNIVFIDKVENYQPYFYRLRGVTPFGEWSAPSKIVKGMGVDKTPPAPARKVATQWIAGTTMEVSWEVVDSADAAHFYIARAQDYRGPYEILTPQPMLDPTARSHQDTSANPFGINYYVVGTVDTARNVSISNPIVGFIEDKEAPEPPMGLEGTVDTAGIVTLKWRRGAEVDLKGYYVYFSNAKKDVFTNLTNKPIAANEFRDTITLNTLTKKVYYRVAAIDRRGNYSKFSQFLELKRPDIIPPAAPVFKNYQVLDDGISLAWLPSTSSDVTTQLLYRKTQQEGWQLLETFTNSTQQYIDKNILPRHLYEYKILSKDESGLISESASVLKLKSKADRKEKHIATINATPTQESKAVTLVWNPNPKVSHSIKRYIVYRSVDGAPMVTLRTVQPDQSRLEDKRVEQGKQYTYAIKVIYEDGYKSGISESVNVMF